MRSEAYEFVFIGLSLSSSWGNGHATTYRALLRGLHALGRSVLFLEDDKPWYAENRDLPDPDFCTLRFYKGADDLMARFAAEIRSAKAVIIGSYVPDGAGVIDRVAALEPAMLCFYDIDTPVTLARLDRGEEENLARRQVPLFDVYFSFSGGQNLDRLRRRYGARAAEALYCSVDPARYRNTGEAVGWDLGYLGTYSADRQPTLEKLLIEPARRLPDMRFVVAGAQFPDTIDWPENVERIEHVPPAKHASFYSRQRFTLNLTRRDMIRAGWSPSVRLFEAASCMAPMISDHWEGLDELLPDREAIIIARETDDVVGALTGTGEDDRQRLARAAFAIVNGHHTGEARAAQFLAALARHGRPVRGAGAIPVLTLSHGKED